MPSLTAIANACTPPLMRGPIVAARHLLRKRQVLLACFPKSGSTCLAGKLAALPGFCNASFVPDHGHREQEITAQSIREALFCRLFHHQVAQHHTRCSDSTLQLVKRYDVRVVVLIRNLKDCLVSLVDHWQRESCVGPHAFWTDALLADVDTSGISRLEAATITVAPWYINFYLSWLETAARAVEPPPIWLTYETFFADPHREFATLLGQLGLPYDDDAIERVWKTATPDRFNAGIVGRGEAAFSADPGASEALARLISCYPTVDLSQILPPARSADQASLRSV